MGEANLLVTYFAHESWQSAVSWSGALGGLTTAESPYFEIDLTNE
jgi:hypothetical protein